MDEPGAEQAKTGSCEPAFASATVSLAAPGRRSGRG